MSFASDVKVELGKLKIDDCCKIAELSAFLQLSSEITFNNDGVHVSFKTMNNTIARTFVAFIKDKYNLPINLVVKEQKLTKNDVYVIIIDNAKEIGVAGVPSVGIARLAPNETLYLAKPEQLLTMPLNVIIPDPSR